MRSPVFGLPCPKGPINCRGNFLPLELRPHPIKALPRLSLWVVEVWGTVPAGEVAGLAQHKQVPRKLYQSPTFQL